jgi:Protein of unknown function (DUF4225)
MDRINSASREVAQHFLNEPHSEGMIADGVMSMAEFMGFSRESGLGAYKGVSLVANVYGIYGLLYKPNAWRLFNHMPNDFYRKVDSMSRQKLTIKVIGWGLKTKVVFDLLSTE